MVLYANEDVAGQVEVSSGNFSVETISFYGATDVLRTDSLLFNRENVGRLIMFQNCAADRVRDERFTTI